MENIEKFDDLVARIFAYLYQHFPVKTNLVPREFGIEDSETVPGTGDFGQVVLVNQAEVQFFYDTVEWLYSAGYIHMLDNGRGHPGRFVALSSKGLEVLKATPASLTLDKSLGEYLASNVKSGAADAVKKGVSMALSMGASLAFQALTK
ncbi:hypothetical protein [Burkholderia cenocepacia]|uniref:hypothetical protein n=1 Tax=Burkholderia cenocepacia TaxID=95486 RepID=UPI00097BEC99|nr:hypothetical protein [Burkholderia cenocepacia]AQQ20632.1 hypothetical protein A8D61_20275 [Burkholderia cenocepacia]ONJ20388.1 hypothetical protein A8D82_16210 [Burkholderia cenocepacia]ONN77692.1 hypothetical protein A8D63_37590 [Burkholderia cenocepacia]ONN78449.1 hypothetical protein A8D62_36380 [Burkholderia cenocepacia]ONN82533.1 hypothetical protein A8D64_26155 [Burkholderia cenocepacia]